MQRGVLPFFAKEMVIGEGVLCAEYIRRIFISHALGGTVKIYIGIFRFDAAHWGLWACSVNRRDKQNTLRQKAGGLLEEKRKSEGDKVK